MGGSDTEQGAADYGHLPSDVLHLIFQSLLHLPGDSMLPLSMCYKQWVYLRLSCKHWGEALVSLCPPLCVALTSAPEGLLLSWLARWPVTALRLAPTGTLGAPVAGGIEGGNGAGAHEWGRTPAHEVLPYASLLGGLVELQGDAPGHAQQAFWSLADWPGLQVIQLALQPPHASLSSEPYAALTQLRELAVRGLAVADLAHLPASLRRLSLAYGSDDPITVPCLPPHLRLDWLSVRKAGVLGFCPDDVWDCCAEVELAAAELLLGAPVRDPGLVATFERPYREGAFVPPHIYADEAAVEASGRAAGEAVGELVRGLATCQRLLRLVVSGGCTASIKIVPVAPQGSASLTWLHGVVRRAAHGLSFLYGLSPTELGDALRAHGQAAEAGQAQLAAPLLSERRCEIAVLRDATAAR